MAETLVDIYDQFQPIETSVICRSWELANGRFPALAVIPFLEKEAVIEALCKYAIDWGIDPVISTLEKLGVRISSINKEEQIINATAFGDQFVRRRVAQVFHYVDIEQLIDGKWVFARVVGLKR